MKHIPMRTCVVTRQKKPKNELARFAIDPIAGRFVLDEKGKIKARGANLSLDLNVFDEAVEKGIFERTLKAKLSDDDIKDARESLEKFIERVRFRKGQKQISVRVQGKEISLD